MSDQTKYTNKLNGKRILIIGGSSGIGFGVAEASLESGANVIISSSKQARVDDAISRLLKSYPSAKSRLAGYAYSMGEQETLESNVQSLLKKSAEGGKLDHIVWTAGDPLSVMKIADATVEKVQKAGMVRFFGPVMLGKYAPQYLNAGPASSIVLTTGSVSEKPRPDWSVVGSFATALQGLNRGLALDLKPIRVNLISPGAVETELWDPLGKETKEKLMKDASAKAPTGSVGKVQDVAEAYLYLMKDQNVTGVMVSSNSGMMLV